VERPTLARPTTSPMKMSGNIDRDFATIMIHHHQQALRTAQAQLQHGKDAQMRKRAQEIIATCEKEIAALQAWQAHAQQS
jgi:uncharacterized protein (DUF305 family)